MAIKSGSQQVCSKSKQASPKQRANSVVGHARDIAMRKAIKNMRAYRG